MASFIFRKVCALELLVVKTGVPVVNGEIAVQCAHDAIVPLADLKPNPANPNRHPEPQIALLSKIIKAQGWRNPIVVSNRSGLITKGHARLTAAKLIGMDTAPVDYQDYASASEELADMIADNRIAELAEPDRSMLAELMEQLDDGAFDMDLTGFDHDALEELMTAAPPASDIDAEPQIDKAAELAEKWGVKRGQIWQLGEHRLMCGDATSRADAMKLMDGSRATSTIADPPYNVGLEYGTDTNDKRDPDDFWKWQRKWFDVAAIISQRQVVTPGCVNLERWITDFSPNHVAVWDKGEGANTFGRITKFWAWEPIMCHKKFERLRHTDVFRISALGNNPGHPCPKPISLWIDILMTLAIGVIIYEPFVGSGTTIIACEQLGRKCRAMEIDPGYCAVSIQRWADATGKTPKLIGEVNHNAKRNQSGKGLRSTKAQRLSSRKSREDRAGANRPKSQDRQAA